MQILSERYFSRQKMLWFGFGEAKPNLSVFAQKITFILGFSSGQTPSENQHTSKALIAQYGQNDLEIRIHCPVQQQG